MSSQSALGTLPTLRTVMTMAPLTGTGLIALDPDEQHHIRSVLRLRVDDQVRVLDGVGGGGVARVVAVDRHGVSISVQEIFAIPEPRLANLTVALAVPKGDRAAEAVRGLTELGVGAVWFIDCQRGERDPALPRLQRVAREAVKQCRRGWVPDVRAGVTLPELLQTGQRLCIADGRGGPAVPGPVLPTILAVGPEGGFTEAEYAALVAGGGLAVGLAGPILRIETAAIAGAAVWAAAWDGGQSAGFYPGNRLS